ADGAGTRTRSAGQARCRGTGLVGADPGQVAGRERGTGNGEQELKTRHRRARLLPFPVPRSPFPVPRSPFPVPAFAYRTPCISLLISGAIRNSSTPPPSRTQKPNVYPDSAESTVIPPSPLTWPANSPARLLPIGVDRNQPPMPRPTSRTGASLVTIDRPIGDRHSSPAVCST